ncbi:signal recognition particle, SRP19 subunit [Bisporella sp. PMI_857]|nr:signal recognition particle, SRP19 subunit [Bisporella sp. PMI_857]KAH8600581.1 signal recognition particle, SRP19 subunit [Bisporella sp. PMI_857]
MSRARVEEVSDSDLDSDPSEGNISDLDPTEFDEREIIKRRVPSAPKPRPSQAQAQSSLINPSNISREQILPGFQNATAPDADKYKNFQCLYPIYFDRRRTRAEGRRVGVEMAVENPLAREIVAACTVLKLDTVFEPNKMHPKDWSNPGRVKVRVKGSGKVKNKHHLYTLISKHLLANPATPAHAMSVRIPGFPMPDSKKPYPEPAAPKGKAWKMGTILPYFSPALTGGGVSDDFLKQMMQEMQQSGGQMPPGMPDMSALMGGAGPAGGGGGQPVKKEKKDKKKK